MLIETTKKLLYHSEFTITYDDGTIRIPLKDVKKSINSFRDSHSGKCTTKKLERMVEALNIVPVKFHGSSSLYVTWNEYRLIEHNVLAYEMGESDNEIFNLRV